jgi:hypothetical protein
VVRGIDSEAVAAATRRLIDLFSDAVR